MQLKTLNRQQSLYAKTKTMMKNNLIALLDQTYPGVNALFDSPVREDGSQKWVDFATAFWHVDCVRNMSLTAFAERYRKWCKRHGYNFSQSKAVEVHTGAQDLIAMLPKDALTKTMVRQAIDALNAVSASLERLKAEMQALAAQLPEYPVVMAMHGVGDSLGLSLWRSLGMWPGLPTETPLPLLRALTLALTSPALTRLRAQGFPKAGRRSCAAPYSWLWTAY